MAVLYMGGQILLLLQGGEIILLAGHHQSRTPHLIQSVPQIIAFGAVRQATHGADKIRIFKQRDQQYTAMQRQSTVEQGFQDIRTKYNLNDQQLNEFATSLIQNNLNPLEKDVDLMKEYRNMHFEDLIQDAVTKAVANEQSRAATATQTSTNPGSQQTNAAAPGAPAKINSVRDLQTWFNDQNK